MITNSSQKPIKSIQSFPAEKRINDNYELIKEKNSFLDKLLKERNQIQADICRLPSHVKRQEEKDKKEKLELKLDKIEQDIYKTKKFLKDFKVTTD